MYLSNARVTVLLVVALLKAAAPAGAAAQSAPGGATSQAFGRVHETDDAAGASRPERFGVIRGSVTDQSAGVLPGVTVVASSTSGRPLDTTVTNASGEFVFGRLPAGIVDLYFRLSGFNDATTRVTIHPPGHTPGPEERLVQLMELPARAESVVVRGDPPVALPPPRPVLAPVPAHEQASVCGPARVEGVAPVLGTVRSRSDDETKVLFGAGDVLLIDGGTALRAGQNFVVRRQYPTALRYGRNKSLTVMGEHSSGLLQIVAVDSEVATAVVVYACDEMMRGDYLAPFEPEPARDPEPVAPPAFDDAVRILFADAGQPLGVPGRMMVIDRGARDNVRTGQRFTLFRRSRFGDARPIVLGESVVVSVRTHSATIRVERATDAIFFGERGDWAAPQRP